MAYWTIKSKAYVNKQHEGQRLLKQILVFLNDSLTLNEIKELENIPDEFELKYLRILWFVNGYCNSVKGAVSRP